MWAARVHHPLRSRHREHRGGIIFFLCRETTAKEKHLSIVVKYGNALSWLPAGLSKFSGPSSPGPAKIQLLCVLCDSVVIFFLHQAMSNYLWSP
jgi:hypothetical protein